MTQISIALHTALSHQDKRNTYVRMLFIDYSSAFNTIVPAYREEVRDLAVCCQDNNLSLNVSKTKELIVDYRKRRAEHAPIHIDRL